MNEPNEIFNEEYHIEGFAVSINGELVERTVVELHVCILCGCLVPTKYKETHWHKFHGKDHS